jgi:hypothetical protein
VISHKFAISEAKLLAEVRSILLKLVQKLDNSHSGQFVFSENKLLPKVDEFPLQQFAVIKLLRQDGQSLWRAESLCPAKSQ